MKEDLLRFFEVYCLLKTFVRIHQVPSFDGLFLTQLRNLLGLLQTYYDEQIHVHESEHSLYRVLQTLHRVKAQNRHVLIAEVDVENPPEGKEHLSGMIRAATEVTLSMQPVDAGYELIEQRSIKWDETTNPSPWSLTGTE